MNQQSRIIVIAAVLIAISPGVSLAQTEVTDYTLRSWQNVTGQPFLLGDDACAVLGLPDGCIAPFTGGYMELGELRCLKGTPTGNPMQPCSKPSPVHVRNSRGWVTAAMTFSTEPGDPVTAFLIFTTNANWDADYTGPAWGEMSAIFCDDDDDMPSFDGRTPADDRRDS